MRQIRQQQRSQQQAPRDPASDPFAEAATQSLATITHGPYLEQVPIAGLTLGQVRRRFRDRFNLPEDGLAMVDGNQVEEDTLILAGQLVTFMHRANAKGVSRASAFELAIEDDDVVVRSPEGDLSRAQLAQVIPDLMPRRLGCAILPDGVKLVREFDKGAIVVHQTAPRLHNLSWIAADSEADYGPKTTYRRVRVALPYLIVFAIYRIARNGKLQLSGANEAFFTNKPLDSMEDPLCYPALLNVSKMGTNEDAKPLAWICTQYLDRRFEMIVDEGVRIRTGFCELLRHMLEDGFNLSSEHNEGASWFGETARAGVDERLASIEAWQDATLKDPLFALEVPWLPTGLTLGGVLDRTATYMKLDRSNKLGSADVARVVVNRAGRQSDED